MKKSLLAFFVILVNLQFTIAQNPKLIINSDNKFSGIKDALDNYLCEIFEFPDYQGRSIKIYENTQLDSLPFPLSFWHYSIKVKGNSSDYVLRIRSTCNDEFPTYTYSNLRRGGRDFIQTSGRGNDGLFWPLRNVCGISVEKVAYFKVTLNAIETDIHNNDCKKMYGEVKVVMTETTDGNPSIISKITDTRTRSDSVLYYWGTAGTLNNSMRDQNLFFQQRQNLHITSTPSKFISSYPNNNAIYITTERALRENRVVISVLTDLGSAHKNSDLDPFFTWGIKMKKSERSTALLQSLPSHADPQFGKEFIVGPYTAYGSTPGTADGGYNNPHIIRLHFTINPLTNYTHSFNN